MITPGQRVLLKGSPMRRGFIRYCSPNDFQIFVIWDDGIEDSWPAEYLHWLTPLELLAEAGDEAVQQEIDLSEVR